MELMHDFSKATFNAIGLRSSTQELFKSKVDPSSVEIEYVENSAAISVEPAVAIFDISSENQDEAIHRIESFRQKFQSSSLVLISEVLELDRLSQILSRFKVFSVLTDLTNLKQVLVKGFEKFSEQKNYNETLLRVKKQNKNLEGLKLNLEDLVHERTKSEFEENKQMEATVKELQSLLRFIKSVSRLETIEELMALVRDEFKKLRGIMPPLLLLADNTRSVRVYYFQGKQLIGKRVNRSEDFSNLKQLDKNLLKKNLSNFLGRPFGQPSILDFKFNAEELHQFNAIMVFEESLGERQKGTFHQFSEERWPIINMALESLMLKESLQNIARQWARTFNEMEDPIIIVDQNFKMSLSNSDFHKNPEQHCYEAFAQRSTPCKDCPVQETFSKGVPKTSDIRVGSKIYRVHSYPIRLQGYDGASHVINQYVDVTQSIDLQSRVIQGEKMAAVGLLAGNIAHELNNPLTGIYSLSDLLLQDLKEESNLSKDLTEVKSAAKRCQRIIKDLLEFTEVGEDSRAKKIDVNDLLRKTLPLLKMAMRTLNSDIDLGETPLFVKMNPQLLQQVLFNLINNACQAMEDSGHLYVTAEKKGSWVEILIRDTGSGIPDEIADSIFDPFFTTKEEGQGTGLGLSMSKSVVERAGGMLELNRDLEVGTEFIVKLPVVQE